MQLTIIQEADLLDRYTPMAKRLIADYCSACELDIASIGDDLLQEAYIEMLIHIRAVEREEEIPLVKLKIVGAIYTALRRMYVVYIPKHAYKKQRNMFRREPYEELILGVAPNMEDDLLFAMTFSTFLDDLNPQERFVIEKKMERCPHRDLVSFFGIQNEMAVSRILHRLRGELRVMLTDE